MIVNTMNEALERYNDLFVKYNFYVEADEDKIISDNKGVIYINENDRYIVFKNEENKDLMVKLLQDFVKRQNKAFKEGKGWID